MESLFSQTVLCLLHGAIEAIRMELRCESSLFQLESTEVDPSPSMPRVFIISVCPSLVDQKESFPEVFWKIPSNVSHSQVSMSTSRYQIPAVSCPFHCLRPGWPLVLPKLWWLVLGWCLTAFEFPFPACLLLGQWKTFKMKCGGLVKLKSHRVFFCVFLHRLYHSVQPVVTPVPLGIYNEALGREQVVHIPAVTNKVTWDV